MIVSLALNTMKRQGTPGLALVLATSSGIGRARAELLELAAPTVGMGRHASEGRRCHACLELVSGSQEFILLDSGS